MPPLNGRTICHADRYPDNMRIFFNMCPADRETAKQARAKHNHSKKVHMRLLGSVFLSSNKNRRQRKDNTIIRMEPMRSTSSMGR